MGEKKESKENWWYRWAVNCLNQDFRWTCGNIIEDILEACQARPITRTGIPIHDELLEFYFLFKSCISRAYIKRKTESWSHFEISQREKQRNEEEIEKKQGTLRLQLSLLPLPCFFIPLQLVLSLYRLSFNNELWIRAISPLHSKFLLSYSYTVR